MISASTSLIVVAFGDEPELETCLDALLAETGAEDEIVLVDNGFRGGPARLAGYGDRLRVVGDGANLGFTGGCNLAASVAAGDVLVFINSDAIVQPGAIAALAAVAARPSVGIASGCLRLADDPTLLNSSGNPVHYLGVTWAGNCGEPVLDFAEERSVTAATGGFFAVRRALWNELGGFPDLYFAYQEDTELSLRCHLLGLDVVYVPSAAADHHYEFSRNALKMYLLERNRLMVVATVYPRRTLRAVLPMLLLTEPLFLVMAVLQGWAGQKLRSWLWLVRHRAQILERRRMIQATRTLDEGAFARLLTARIEPTMVTPPPGMPALNRVLAAYWRFAAPRSR